jgi:hypothetical protein
LIVQHDKGLTNQRFACKISSAGGTKIVLDMYY